jgi:hypothetical protein
MLTNELIDTEIEITYLEFNKKTIEAFEAVYKAKQIKENQNKYR